MGKRINLKHLFRAGAWRGIEAAKGGAEGVELDGVMLVVRLLLDRSARQAMVEFGVPASVYGG
jgi:hypothetical protein